MHAVVEEGRIMNWDNILVSNLLGVLKKHKDAPRGKDPLFYTVAYLLDLVCAPVHFPELKLQWGHKNFRFCGVTGILFIFIPFVI